MTVSRSSYKLRQGNSFANDYVQARDLSSSEFLQRERKCAFSTLKHGEAAVTDCNRTKDIRRGSDKQETG